MVLEDIGLYLQANGLGILGQDIFLGSIPLDAPGSGVQDAVLGLFEVPGLPGERIHDSAGVSVRQPVVQLRHRGAPYGYQAVRQQAEAAHILLSAVVNQTINGTFYRQILDLQDPFGQPQDEWNRPFVICEYRCIKSP
jgi:hypothetical protein